MAKAIRSVGAVRRRARRSTEQEDVDGLLLDDEPYRALGEGDIGLDAAAFYRWRRVRSEPPPPMGPSGSSLARYKPRSGRA